MTEENNPLDQLPTDTPPANEEETMIPQAAPGAEDAQDAGASVLPEYTMADLPEPLQAGFRKMGWTSLMQVQARAIPYILAHRDVMIQSRTGSGKTGAYLVPVFQRINPEVNATQALVLVPTRELAQQVIHEAEILGSAMNIRSVAVYGGTSYGPQLDAFRQGAHLVVGTPGRILDHLLRRSLTLDKLKILIFDEADRMLSMGFYPDMKRVQRYLPRGPFNTYMFSATFPPRVIALANEFMRKPDFLNLSSDHVHVTETDHVIYTVRPMDKERSLIRIIEVENPASVLIFCNTRERVHFVAVILQRYGYNAAEISSDLTQSAREEVMEQIRQGTLRFLVATDVASRGIDIPELSHVILYEVPEDPESYIHRAGRTGRAGASGVAISLVNALERAELVRIGKRFTINFEERPVPTEEDVQAIISQRNAALLESRLRERDRLQTERMQRFLPFLTSLGEDEEALAGVAMLLDDFYHENFHTIQTPQPTGRAPEEPGAHKYTEPGHSSRKSHHGRKPGGERGSGRIPPRGLSGGPASETTAPSPAAEPPSGGSEHPSGARSGSHSRRRRGGRGRGPGPKPPEGG
jgi:ATP-dependent RNA helicase DeaD